MEYPEEKELIPTSNNHSEFTYEEISEPPEYDPANFHQEIHSINFQSHPQDLLDLDQDQVVYSTFKQSPSYLEYILDRTVAIQGPILIHDGYLMSYKLYKIKTKKGDGPYQTCVSRRFSDFQFLHEALIERYGGCVIPKLPEKSIWTSLNWESNQFKDVRIKSLHRYLIKLLAHNRIRSSQELKQFLFQDDNTFSSRKGEYFEKVNAFDAVKSLTTTAMGYGRMIVDKLSNRETDQSLENEKKQLVMKNTTNDLTIIGYQREVDELMRISNEVRSIVVNTHKEIHLLTEISQIFKTLAEGCPSILPIQDNQLISEEFTQFLQEYDDLCSFIESCSEAIKRRKNLRIQIQQLRENQHNLIHKSKQNPRNSELDVIRSKLTKSIARCDKWTNSLVQELSTHTNEGRSMIEQFIKKFTKIKGEIYLKNQIQ